MNYRTVITLLALATLSAIHGAHHAQMRTLQALIAKQPSSKKAASDLAARIKKLVAEKQDAAARINKQELREIQIQLLALEGPNAPLVKKYIIAYGTELCLTEPNDKNELIVHPGNTEDLLRAQIAYTLSQAAQSAQVARAATQQDSDTELYDDADKPLPTPAAAAAPNQPTTTATSQARYFFDPRGWFGW